MDRTAHEVDAIERRGGYRLQAYRIIGIDDRALSEHDTIDVLVELNSRARVREEDDSPGRNAAHKQGYEEAVRDVRAALGKLRP